LEIRVILPKDKCSATLLSEKNRKMIENKVMDEIKISVIASDKFCMLELPGPDGKIDQNTAIFGYDDRFREWCKSSSCTAGRQKVIHVPDILIQDKSSYVST